jgi:hypothetical protein
MEAKDMLSMRLVSPVTAVAMAGIDVKMEVVRAVVELHPSKCTSPTEAKYKLYILEFAVLKFGLDQFSDIIWSAPVEIEMDCQALKDTLLSPKLGVTHA